jgi:EAL domain-containing protein (putative c-di-GMP-specific phosphodiesterase class I)
VRYLIKPAPIPELVRGIERAIELRHGLGPERKMLDEALTRALSRLWMAYQPIVSWPPGGLHGYEALVRSDEPGFASPPALLGAAERLDRLHDVGRAIRAAVARTAATSPTETFFVNLHPLDLDDPDLVDPRAPLSRVAGRVVLEITERSSLDLIPDLDRRLAAVRAVGYRIAVDDLGAGYAGLTALAELEPDVVKIDMSLTRGIDVLPTKQRLVAAIISVCEDMGRRLVCEGVETAEERDTLARLGCRLFQGYLFARPGRELREPAHAA